MSFVPACSRTRPGGLSARHARARPAHARAAPAPGRVPVPGRAPRAGSYRKRAAVPTPSSSPQTPPPPPLAPANSRVRAGSPHPAARTTAAKITHRTVAARCHGMRAFVPRPSSAPGQSLIIKKRRPAPNLVAEPPFARCSAAGGAASGSAMPSPRARCGGARWRRFACWRSQHACTRWADKVCCARARILWVLGARGTRLTIRP